jgi:hypothetical protein
VIVTESIETADASSHQLIKRASRDIGAGSVLNSDRLTQISTSKGLIKRFRVNNGCRAHRPIMTKRPLEASAVAYRRSFFVFGAPATRHANSMRPRPAIDANNAMGRSLSAKLPGEVSRRRRARRRHRNIAYGYCLLAAVSLACAVALKTHHPTSTQSAEMLPAIAAIAPDENRSAKVFIDTGDGGCRQESFDNQTWRLTRTRQPCDLTDRDINGNPVPSGTIHRLEAISKTFK